MTIPTLDNLMLPILKLVNNGISTPLEARERIYKEFSLTNEEIAEKLPKGSTTKIINRIHWSFTHLRGAGLLDRIDKGTYKISTEGKKLLNKNLNAIDRNFLMHYNSFREFITKNKSTSPQSIHSNIENNDINIDNQETPDEQFEHAFINIENTIISDLKETIKQLKPAAFEKLVLEVMKGIGYGVGGMLEHTGGTADGGIDGVIYEDALGLNAIYLQAKRYTDSIIERKDIQSFAGAMDGESATRGVFVTTSVFTNEAKIWTKQSPKHIKLIDGDELVNIMLKNSIGLRVYKTYEIKRIDADFFNDLDN